MNIKYICAAGLLVAGVTISSANAETYICKVKTDAHDLGWISKTIAVNVNNKTGDILVSDGLILNIYKKPILATLVVDTDKRLTVKWEVNGLKTDRNATVPRFFYRITILKARGNKAIVKAYAAGYSGDLGASGKCVSPK